MLKSHRVDGTVGMEGMGPALDEIDRAGRR